MKISSAKESRFFAASKVSSVFFSLSLGCLGLDLLFMTNDVCFFRSDSVDLIFLSSFFTALEAALSFFLCCRLSFLDLGGSSVLDEACFLLGDITDLVFVSLFFIAFVERANFSFCFCLFFSSLDGCFLHGLDRVLSKVSEDLFLGLGI